MASVPATTTQATPSTEQPVDQIASLDINEPPRLASDFLTGFNNLSVIRQIGFMLGLAAAVGLAAATILWSQSTGMRPLYHQIEGVEIDAITQLLDENNINYEIDYKKSSLLVNENDYHKARLKLAAADITTSAKIVGFERLDEEPSLGTSQFMELARFRRSLEGELARTMVTLSAVKHARVHLAIPKRSVFVRDQRPASASVMLELIPGRELSRQQVSAIVNLVASSVPQMDKKSITVVDQSGKLLTEQLEDGEMLLAGKQFEYTRKLEDLLIRRVHSILDPIVGRDHYKAEVSAEVDFSQIERTDEQFNPDLPAVRSEQTLSEVRVGAQADGGVPGALTNQPPGENQVPEVAIAGEENAGTNPSRSKKQSTRNYELDRSISFIRQQVGNIKRLSVAVVIDDLVKSQGATQAESAADDAENTNSAQVQGWTEMELTKIGQLVKDAIGYDLARGDSVNVISAAFVPQSPVEFEEAPVWQQQWFIGMVVKALVILIVTLLLWILLRNLLSTINESGANAKNQLELTQEQMRQLTKVSDDEPEDSSETEVTLAAIDETLLPTQDEAFERELRLIKEMIVEDPGRVAMVVKQWILLED